MSDTVEANLAAARRAYEIWNAEGLEAFREQFWAPDFVLYEAAEFPDADVFHGAEAVADHLRDMFEVLGHFQHKLHSLEGRGAYGLAGLELTTEGQSSGALVTTRVFHVARMEGGRLVEVRIYLDEARARADYERLSAQGD